MSFEEQVERATDGLWIATIIAKEFKTQVYSKAGVHFSVNICFYFCLLFAMNLNQPLSPLLLSDIIIAALYCLAEPSVYLVIKLKQWKKTFFYVYTGWQNFFDSMSHWVGYEVTFVDFYENYESVSFVMHLLFHKELVNPFTHHKKIIYLN